MARQYWQVAMWTALAGILGGGPADYLRAGQAPKKVAVQMDGSTTVGRHRHPLANLPEASRPIGRNPT